MAVGWWGSTVSDIFGAPAAILFAMLVVTMDRKLQMQETGAGFAGGQTLWAA